MNKKNIRNDMLRKRAIISASLKKEHDKLICERLKEYVLANNISVVHCYIPMLDEINLRPFIDWLLSENKRVVCPKVVSGHQLLSIPLESLAKVKKGVFGTVYPASDEVFEGEIELIVVPGLAFDTSKNRLGYGGAYYDRFLLKHKNALCVGAFYELQKMKQVPVEPHDVVLDKVLSEHRWY